MRNSRLRLRLNAGNRAAATWLSIESIWVGIMHNSARVSGAAFLKAYCCEGNVRILDVGSCDVNGSLRQFQHPGMEYIGVDIEPGPGVDIVAPSADKLPFGDGEFDAILSTSTCEHAASFWTLLLEMVRVTKPNGYIYINAPSNGAFHQFPFDYWRFYPDAGLAFVEWGRKSGCDISLVESGIGAQGQEQWSDFVAVLQKSGTPRNHGTFICTPQSSFRNIRRYDTEGVLDHSHETEDQIKIRELNNELSLAREQQARDEDEIGAIKSQLARAEDLIFALKSGLADGSGNAESWRSLLGAAALRFPARLREYRARLGERR